MSVNKTNNLHYDNDDDDDDDQDNDNDDQENDNDDSFRSVTKSSDPPQLILWPRTGHQARRLW